MTTATKPPSEVLVSQSAARHAPRPQRGGVRQRFVRGKQRPKDVWYVSTLAELGGRLSDDFDRGPEKFIILDLGMPSEAIPERLLRLRVRDPDRIFLKRVRNDAEARKFLRRLRTLLSYESREEQILDAWWEDDEFVVLSPTLRRLRVPLAALRTIRDLRKARRNALRSFSIDQDGDFVHWPSPDVHMNWEAFEQMVDPQARLRAEQRSAEFNRRYGQAIRRFREERGIRQHGIDGLDARHVRRIENGQQRATLKALEKLAVAHGLSTNRYMGQLAQRLAD